MDCRVAIAPRNDDTKMEDNNHKRGRNDDIEVLNSYTTTYNNKKRQGTPSPFLLSHYLPQPQPPFDGSFSDDFLVSLFSFIINSLKKIEPKVFI